tara:strand:+ start:13690 stop:13842 length:153 start_codon:yes stop_codon:yes gene_type:complete
MLAAFYRNLPELIIRYLVFAAVGGVFALSYVFLAFRPVVRQVRARIIRGY